jgi:hypothetical protein
VGGGIGQRAARRAVAVANGEARDDVGAVLEGDVRVLASSEGAAGAGTREGPAGGGFWHDRAVPLFV